MISSSKYVYYSSSVYQVVMFLCGVLKLTCAGRSTGPIDCVNLKNKVALECDKMEDRLMNTWFPKVIHLLTSKDMIKGVKADKLDSFYNCASTLISNQVH